MAAPPSFDTAFDSLQKQGNSLLGTMSKIQLTTLVDYRRRLSALNARQQQAARIENADILARFVVSDFDGIDQGVTTATARADTATATLRERRIPSDVLVSSTSFTSSAGTVEAIDSKGMLYSVYSDGGVPVGTFNLTLSTVTDVSLFTIDISAMASVPRIDVSVSANGLTWTTCRQACTQRLPTEYVAREDAGEVHQDGGDAVTPGDLPAGDHSSACQTRSLPRRAYTFSAHAGERRRCQPPFPSPTVCCWLARAYA